MSKFLTIELPNELEHQLTWQAQKLNISVEELVLRSLHQTLGSPDEDDEPKEAILNSLRTSLQEIQDGEIHPLAQLWDGSDE